MKKIGVYGGTFDPVHFAHIKLAKAAIEECGLDELIIMPAHINPFKEGKNVTGDGHRFKMLELAFESVPKVYISSYEMESKTLSYTFDTLDYIKTLHPDDEIMFILGWDSFLTFPTWFKGEDMLRTYSLIVVMRPGYEEKDNDIIQSYEEKYNAKIYKLKAAMPDISSTLVRDYVRNGEDISDLVPENVGRYILENRLFRS